mmetsp:Transcript_1644/g.5357  ORF Transcript_1644/g.5357 Transcript_1644/m.5357 type:complete len:213 (-) Transcript_1644:1063-1701(-)
MASPTSSARSRTSSGGIWSMAARARRLPAWTRSGGSDRARTRAAASNVWSYWEQSVSATSLRSPRQTPVTTASRRLCMRVVCAWMRLIALTRSSSLTPDRAQATMVPTRRPTSASDCHMRLRVVAFSTTNWDLGRPRASREARTRLKRRSSIQYTREFIVFSWGLASARRLSMKGTPFTSGPRASSASRSPPASPHARRASRRVASAAMASS